MRMLIRAAFGARGVAGLAGMLLAPTARATTAAGPVGRLPATNGTTTITTADSPTHDPTEQIGNLLIFAGIAPTAIAPARNSLSGAFMLFPNPGGFSSEFRFTLPVVAGELGPHSLRGTVAHSGGILFSDRHSLLEISNLVVNLKDKTMTATLTLEPYARTKRIALFRLDLSHARIKPDHRNDVRAVGIGLNFTKAAAGVLDRVLATRIFAAGQQFGTATIVLEDVQAVS